MGVLMDELTIDEVREGFEPAVRMPGRALWLPWGVLNLAHLIHMDKRVEISGVDAGERPANWEALALIARRASRDGRDTSGSGIKWQVKTGKGQRVGGDRWHGGSSRWF
jgi:hypothetical protein